MGGRGRIPAALLGLGAVVAALTLSSCGRASTPRASGAGQAARHTLTSGTASSSTTTSTSAPCDLSSTPGTANTVPVTEVCSSQAAPHFETPAAAMAYLAQAWNTDNVQELDYVTDPAGRQELDSMASLMQNLQFDNCTANPAGDYTCYFTHDIAPSTSSTTYPNPGNYPPGEAVFTVGPAQTPGWYLTEVIHCG